jgi:hypothetical protein
MITYDIGKIMFFEILCGKHQQRSDVGATF